MGGATVVPESFFEQMNQSRSSICRYKPWDLDDLDRRSVDRTKAIDFGERESIAGLICGSFGKWEDNEGEREFLELGGGST